MSSQLQLGLQVVKKHSSACVALQSRDSLASCNQVPTLRLQMKASCWSGFSAAERIWGLSRLE